MFLNIRYQFDLFVSKKIGKNGHSHGAREAQGSCSRLIYKFNSRKTTTVRSKSRYGVPLLNVCFQVDSFISNKTGKNGISHGDRKAQVW